MRQTETPLCYANLYPGMERAVRDAARRVALEPYALTAMEAAGNYFDVMEDLNSVASETMDKGYPQIPMRAITNFWKQFPAAWHAVCVDHLDDWGPELFYVMRAQIASMLLVYATASEQNGRLDVANQLGLFLDGVSVRHVTGVQSAVLDPQKLQKVSLHRGLLDLYRSCATHVLASAQKRGEYGVLDHHLQNMFSNAQAVGVRACLLRMETFLTVVAKEGGLSRKGYREALSLQPPDTLKDILQKKEESVPLPAFLRKGKGRGKAPTLTL